MPGLRQKRKFYYSKPLLGATAFALERAMQQEASENLTAKPTEFRGHHTWMREEANAAL